MAIGIDSLAHEAALNTGLATIAFPGSTLEWSNIQPRQHERLAHRIVAGGGTLLSPWKVGYDTGSWCFPARNRLMAAISHATLIIEAARHSGSLMTAKYAEDLSRDVYAVPGSIFSANSYGPHMLIRKVAACISSSEDVLHELGFAVKSTQTRFELVLKTLAPDVRRVAEAIALGETTVDQLFERLENIPIHTVLTHISELELLGLVRSGPTGIKLV